MSDHHPDDAEIEASRAPLLDHLIELRKRLIICVAAIILGMIVCFAFSREIYLFLVRPFNVAAEILAVHQQHHVQATPGLMGSVIDTLTGEVAELTAAHGLDLLAQVVQLGLPRHLVEAGAEFRRHAAHLGHELAEAAQQHGQVLGPHHDQRHDGDQDQFGGADFGKHRGVA